MTLIFQYGTTIKKYTNRTSDRIVPVDRHPSATRNEDPKTRKVRENLSKANKLLDDDGIAAPGSKIENGDVYINKQTPTQVRDPVSPTLSSLSPLSLSSLSLSL